MSKLITDLNLKLTPRLNTQLQNALSVLQLSALQLQATVTDWLADNPFLEQADDSVMEADSDDVAQQYVQPPQSIHLTDSENDIWNTVSIPASVYTQWHQQVDEHGLDEHMAGLVHFLVDNLNEQGYLHTSLVDLVENTPLQWQLNEADLAQALTILQQFEPAGTGARDLSESLLLQLKSWFETEKKSQLQSSDLEQEYQCARQLICQHLGQWNSTHQISQLYRQLPEYKRATIHDALKRIRTLNPFPCYGLDQAEPTVTIQPDLQVYSDHNGQLKIRLMARAQPALCLSQYSLDLNSAELNEACKNKWQEAQNHIRSLDMRKNTLSRLGKWILQQQHDFFIAGAQALKPLSIKDTALALGLAESTISRALQQKYLICHQGILPLRYFFSQAVANEQTQSDNSQTALKALIQQLISKEDRANPYSDTELVHQLSLQGIKLARRTVTKYRQDLKIAPAHQRKLYDI